MFSIIQIIIIYVLKVISIEVPTGAVIKFDCGVISKELRMSAVVE